MNKTETSVSTIIKFNLLNLRSGMIVEYRKTGLRLVVENPVSGTIYLLGLKNHGTVIGMDIHEDLSNDDPDYDIMAVYVPYKDADLETLLSMPVNKNLLNCIWKRPTPSVELTLQEIADKFHIPVDLIRIKE